MIYMALKPKGVSLVSAFLVLILLICRCPHNRTVSCQRNHSCCKLESC